MKKETFKNRFFTVSIIVAIIIVALIIVISNIDVKEIKATVYWHNKWVTFDTKRGDEIVLHEESSLPVVIKIDGEWHQFGYSLIDKIILYEGEE